MSDKDVQETLSFLNKTMIHHKQWFNHFLSDLVCQLSSNEPECIFESGTPELDQIHEELHHEANKLLQSNKKNIKCKKKDYDKFITAFEQFNNSIYALQNELEMSMGILPPTNITASMITMLPILREQQTFAKRQLQTCYITLIDIDLLNKIQNEYGDNIKNQILIALAHLLVEHVRTYDKVFCYNNETFLVSLQNVNAAQALDLIDRLRVKIGKTPFNIGLSEPLSITVSCGITALDPAFTIEQALEQASLALYLAKKSGRNNTKSWGH